MIREFKNEVLQCAHGRADSTQLRFLSLSLPEIIPAYLLLIRDGLGRLVGDLVSRGLLERLLLANE